MTKLLSEEATGKVKEIYEDIEATFETVYLLGFFFHTDIFINTSYRLEEWKTLIKSGRTDIYGTPVRLRADAGFIRDWCGRVKGLQTAIALRPVKKDETHGTINGVLYALYGEDSDLVRQLFISSAKIPMECFEPLGWQSLPDFPYAYAVLPRVMEPVDIHYPILQTFLDTCLKGYLEYGEEFAVEFLESTVGWSKYWINDRLLSSRPWVHEKDFQHLDELLAEYPTENNMFHERRLESEYAALFVQRETGQLADDSPSTASQSFRAFSGKLKQQPTHFIFAYGSLINAESRFQTIPKSKDAIPVRISPEFGYFRMWNYQGIRSRLTALGVQKVQDEGDGLSMNGVIYPVDGDDMSLYDKREEGYYRAEVPWELVTVLSWKNLPDFSKSKLWMYVPEKSKPANIDYPIVQSYIDVCLTGCNEYGEEFAREFLETTLGWNQFWMNDRLTARRPWIDTPKHEGIDGFLAKYPTQGNTFKHRKVATEYATLFVAPPPLPEFDPQELIQKVKEIYSEVVYNPHGEFHFEMGRALMERLGYPPETLDKLPVEAVDSFAGVGYHFGLSEIAPGETVLDLGCGSGTDIFFAANKVSENGSVIGIDMTEAQVNKAIRLKEQYNYKNVTIVWGYMEELPFENDQFDLVISNGVINLCVQKEQVFKEAHRVLKAGGRLAISDIVTGVQLEKNIIGNMDLWAACIGGACYIDRYKHLTVAPGFEIKTININDAYQFISKSAKAATEEFNIKSISLVAVKTQPRDLLKEKFN